MRKRALASSLTRSLPFQLNEIIILLKSRTRSNRLLWMSRRRCRSRWQWRQLMMMLTTIWWFMIFSSFRSNFNNNKNAFHSRARLSVCVCICFVQYAVCVIRDLFGILLNFFHFWLLTFLFRVFFALLYYYYYYRAFVIFLLFVHITQKSRHIRPQSHFCTLYAHTPISYFIFLLPRRRHPSFSCSSFLMLYVVAV